MWSTDPIFMVLLAEQSSSWVLPLLFFVDDMLQETPVMLLFFIYFWQMIQESRVLIETADITHDKIVQCQKAGNPSLMCGSG